MTEKVRPSLPPFPSTYRASGLLLHVTSLPTPYGIGDVGPAAIAWIDRLCDAVQSWWQPLPLVQTGYGNSPYQSLSSFAGNGLLISPDWVLEDSLLRPSGGVALLSSSPSAGFLMPSCSVLKLSSISELLKAPLFSLFRSMKFF